MMIPVRVLRGRLRSIVGLGRKLRSIPVNVSLHLILSHWLASCSRIRNTSATCYLIWLSKVDTMFCIYAEVAAFGRKLGRGFHLADMLTLDTCRMSDSYVMDGTEECGEEDRGAFVWPLQEQPSPIIPLGVGFLRIFERAVLTLVDELLAMTYSAAGGDWFCLSHAWKPSGKAVSPLPRHVLL
jgi:hypothetical protein